MSFSTQVNANAASYNTDTASYLDRTHEAVKHANVNYDPQQSAIPQSVILQFNLNDVQTTQVGKAYSLLQQMSGSPSLFADNSILSFLSSIISGKPGGIVEANQEAEVFLQTPIVQARAASAINSKLPEDSNVRIEMAVSDLSAQGDAKVSAGIRMWNTKDHTAAYLSKSDLTRNQLNTVVEDANSFAATHLVRAQGKGKPLALAEMSTGDIVVTGMEFAVAGLAHSTSTSSEVVVLPNNSDKKNDEELAQLRAQMKTANMRDEERSADSVEKAKKEAAQLAADVDKEAQEVKDQKSFLKAVSDSDSGSDLDKTTFSESDAESDSDKSS